MYINIKKYFITLSVFIFSFAVSALLGANYEKIIAKDLSKSVIRFHVRANSDSIQDQQLKMKVKETVVNYLDNDMNAACSTKEALSYLKANRDTVASLAKQVVTENGYNYEVRTSIGNSSFPHRNYGDITFPAGNYTSFIIEIGSGKGHNWWCVLYPPLCFIDASTGVLPDESKDTLKKSISTSEYNYVSADDSEDIQIRFKYLSFLNDIFN